MFRLGRQNYSFRWYEVSIIYLQTMIGHLHAINTGKHWSCLALSSLGNTYRIQNNTSKYALYNNETRKDTYPHNGDKIGQWCVCVCVCVCWQNIKSFCQSVFLLVVVWDIDANIKAIHSSVRFAWLQLKCQSSYIQKIERKSWNIALSILDAQIMPCGV